MNLIKWISQNYPSLFSYQKIPGRSGWVLTINRPKGSEFPELEDKLDLEESGYYQFRDDGFVIPKLIFREKLK